MRQCKDKGHISHPQEKPQSTSTRGRGGRGSRWVHYIGGGVGVPAKPGSYMHTAPTPSAARSAKSASSRKESKGWRTANQNICSSLSLSVSSFRAKTCNHNKHACHVLHCNPCQSASSQERHCRAPNRSNSETCIKGELGKTLYSFHVPSFFGK